MSSVEPTSPDTLSAGPALDRAVAEALGHKVCDKATAIRLTNERELSKPRPVINGVQLPFHPWDSWYAHDWYLEDSLGVFGMDTLPNYSTDWNDAMLAAERVGLFMDCYITQGPVQPDWCITRKGDVPVFADAETGPLAIARAVVRLKQTD